MNFKKWLKSIQTAGYNGASTYMITARPKIEITFTKWKLSLKRAPEKSTY